MKFIPKYFYSLLCIICLTLVQTIRSEAQTKEQNSGLDQTMFEIIKTRTSILENFKKRNIERVRTQRDSLRKTFETDNHLPFFPAEYWLLCFWTKDYSTIISDKFLSDTLQYNNTYVSYPIFDNLGDEVRKTIREQRDEIKQQIDKSSLSTKDKEFLQIVLWYSIHKNNEAKDTLQVTLNELAKDYITKYPNSQNDGMIKGYIIKEYQGLKGADEILFGGGFSVPFGKMSDNLSSGYNLSIDYRRYFGSTFVGLTGNMYSSKLSCDSVEVQNKWMKKDEMFNVYNVGLDFGNRFYDAKRVSLSVYGGGAYNALSITHEINKDQSEQITINTFAVRVGLAFDFKFVKQGTFASFKKYSDFNHTKLFRLKYDFEIPMYSDKAPELKGGIHNITLSIGFNTRNVVKK